MKLNKLREIQQSTWSF